MPRQGQWGGGRGQAAGQRGERRELEQGRERRTREEKEGGGGEKREGYGRGGERAEVRCPVSLLEWAGHYASHPHHHYH